MPETDVVIVGGGIAGLCCARELAQRGVRSVILEAADAPGGRVRTDRVDGFLLDRGFQVYLTAYAEGRRVLDLEALKLKAFYPGASVRCDGAFHLLADPVRKPVDAAKGLLSGVASVADKVRVGVMRLRVGMGALEDVMKRPERETIQMLREAGFGEAIIDRFFRPWFGGVFFDRELKTSSRMFEFVFRMFAEGQTTLPDTGGGMQSIPEQLAAGLSRTGRVDLRLGSRVASIDGSGAVLATGERVTGRAVVVASEGPEAARLLGRAEMNGAWRAVTCVYFAAETLPAELNLPVLVLNGDGPDAGPINNLVVPSAVAGSYAPGGAHLVSVSVLGNPAESDAAVLEAVRRQLATWYGSAVGRWRHLRTYRIARALPEQFPPALDPAQRPVRVTDTTGAAVRGLYVCGDHRENASINGAMASGRRAAEAVATDL